VGSTLPPPSDDGGDGEPGTPPQKRRGVKGMFGEPPLSSESSWVGRCRLTISNPR